MVGGIIKGSDINTKSRFYRRKSSDLKKIMEMLRGERSVDK